MTEEIKSPKFQRLLETAKALFFRYGMKRVSVEEICKTAGVSKMTFYKYYRNKTDLAKVLIDKIIEDQMEKYRNIMSQDIHYAEKVKQIIGFKLEQAEAASQKYMQDMFQHPDPEIIDFVNRRFGSILQVVLNDFIKAQKQGYIRPDIKPEFLVYFLTHMIDLVSDESLVGLYQSTKELVAELMNFFFYGILSKHGDKV